MTKEEFLRLSYQYQREWRFEKDKQLMEHASELYPEWVYPKKRLEWHSRPIFHQDPALSQVQPRKPVIIPRDERYTPSQETLGKMCFVTGADSNQPYFDLVVQLLESIKATNLYKDIPIKVFDCGLTPAAKEYLIKRFNVEVKDPGWDVDPKIIKHGFVRWWSINGMKGCTARPYFHKHFPDFEYYFWMDADFWIQNENFIDIFLHICQEQGLAATYEANMTWDKGGYTVPRYFVSALPAQRLDHLNQKPVLHNGLYCISKTRSEQYGHLCDLLIKERGSYTFGFDMSTLNYFFHTEIKGHIFGETDPYYFPLHGLGDVNNEGVLISGESHIMGGICLAGMLKKFPYRMFFPRSGEREKHAQALSRGVPMDTQEIAYQTCQQSHLKQNNYFYRCFLKPEELYGDMLSNF